MDIVQKLAEKTVDILSATEKDISEDNLINKLIESKSDWLPDSISFQAKKYQKGQRVFDKSKNEWFVVQYVGTSLIYIRYDSGEEKTVGQSYLSMASPNIYEYAKKQLKRVDQKTLDNARLIGKNQIKCIYRLEHIDNLRGILEKGFFCLKKIKKHALNFTDISDSGVQKIREHKIVQPTKKLSLHDYVPLFFTTMTPMLSARRNIQEDIAHLHLSKNVLLLPEIVFTDGNAASASTKFYTSLNDLEKLDWKLLRAESWRDKDPIKHKENGRKRSAEVLVPYHLPVSYIMSISVHDNKALKRVEEITDELGVHLKIKINPDLYFNNTSLHINCLLASDEHFNYFDEI